MSLYGALIIQMWRCDLSTLSVGYISVGSGILEQASIASGVSAFKKRHLARAGMWIGVTGKDSCITTSLGCYSYAMQLPLLCKCFVLEKNQGQLSKLNRPHFWGVKGIQLLDTVKLPGCLGQYSGSISRFDLAVCWRVSMHLRVWKRPMRDERMGTRLVRCRILPPRLTTAIIKPGGCHLGRARMLVFIYADYSALLSAIYCGRHCVAKAKWF